MFSHLDCVFSEISYFFNFNFYFGKLHDRLVAAVESGSFLKQLESLNRNSVDGNGCQFPFKEATGSLF